jgi:malate synthase
VKAEDLLAFAPETPITETGVRTNINVSLQYIGSWIGGNGCVPINNLMEDAATAEISRSQLWQWRVTGTPLDDGRPLTGERYRAIRDEELVALTTAAAATAGAAGPDATRSRLPEAATLLDKLVLDDDFIEFLTLPAYPRLR